MPASHLIRSLHSLYPREQMWAGVFFALIGIAIHTAWLIDDANDWDSFSWWRFLLQSLRVNQLVVVSAYSSLMHKYLQLVSTRSLYWILPISMLIAAGPSLLKHRFRLSRYSDETIPDPPSLGPDWRMCPVCNKPIPRLADRCPYCKLSLENF